MSWEIYKPAAGLSLCQCNPAVGLSDLQGTGAGLAAYHVRSFSLLHIIILHVQTKVILTEKVIYFSGEQ
jgi:hypothetical protein